MEDPLQAKHLRREAPRKVRYMVPAHVWPLVAPYGLSPQPGEHVQASTSEEIPS